MSLAGIEAIHLNWHSGVNLSAYTSAEQTMTAQQLVPQSITAFMLGLESKLATFKVQRQINDYQQEALQAILPGATLLALWQIMGDVENLLLLISVLVLAGALFGMSNMLLVSMRERRYELAILRAIGAGPWLIFVLLQLKR